MAIRVVVHIANEQPFVAEIEELPGPTATNVYLTNPRTRDLKPVSWITDNLRGLVFPMARINFIEVVITRADEREVVGFFKEDAKGN